MYENKQESTLYKQNNYLKNKFSIFKIPFTVHEEWLKYDIGTVIGYVDEDKNLHTSINNVDLKLLPTVTNIDELILCSTQSIDLDEYLENINYLGEIKQSITYTTEIKNVDYIKAYLNSIKRNKRNEGNNYLYPNENKPINSSDVKSTLFQYYNMDLTGSNLRSYSDLDSQTATKKLFELFENNGANGLTVNDIKENMHIKTQLLKRVLNKIADCHKSNNSRRVVYYLKKQYQV